VNLVGARVTTRRLRASRAPGALALAFDLLLVLVGCGGSGSAGRAFPQEPPTWIGAKAIRPGFEIGLLYYDIENTSDSTVVLDSVGIPGPGIGTVVRPVRIMMAPLRYGWHRYEVNSVAAALYTMTPPVLFEDQHCRKQDLVPVKGFKMTPGSDARIWIVLRALRPGRWSIPLHVIYYTQGGVRYRESEPLRAYGYVSDYATYIPPLYDMADCVRPERAAFLPGYHAGRVSD
jgi:hypothetical protein